MSDVLKSCQDYPDYYKYYFLNNQSLIGDEDQDEDVYFPLSESIPPHY